jgi:hypothetical protein
MKYEISTIRKIDKIIIYSIFGSIPTGLLVLFLYFMIFGPSSKQMLTEMYLSDSVSGVVDTVFNDTPNHNIRTAILKNNTIYQIEEEWESQIEAGDSLYKKKGTFLLTVYKRGGKKIVLDYRKMIPAE